jgi:hypothetical protein
MEPPPEGNPDEFGEEPAPIEEEERDDDEDLEDEGEIVESDRVEPPEEEY